MVIRNVLAVCLADVTMTSWSFAHSHHQHNVAWWRSSYRKRGESISIHFRAPFFVKEIQRRLNQLRQSELSTALKMGRLLMETTRMVAKEHLEQISFYFISRTMWRLDNNRKSKVSKESLLHSVGAAIWKDFKWSSTVTWFTWWLHVQSSDFRPDRLHRDCVL